MKKLIVLAALAIASGTAMAGEVYTGVGTIGINLGYAQALTEHIGVRGEYNTLNYDRDFNTSDVDYNGKLKFNSAGFYADYFPFAGHGLRLSAGALVGSNKVTAEGKAKNGNFTVNGQNYSAAGQSVNATAKFPDVQPYVGIGYGFSPNKAGFGLYADMGVAYGKPKATLTVSQGLLAQAGQANVDAERQKLQDELDKLKFYPVVNVGISYQF